MKTITYWRVMIEVRSRSQAHELADVVVAELDRMGNRYPDTAVNTSCLVVDVERDGSYEEGE